MVLIMTSITMFTHICRQFSIQTQLNPNRDILLHNNYIPKYQYITHPQSQYYPLYVFCSVKVNTLPLDIVFNSDTIRRVKNFFVGQQQRQEITSDWTEQLWLRLKELQAHTTSEVRNQIEEMLLGEVSC